MAVNISGLLLPVLLVVACIALVTNIYHTREVNKTLVSDIETAQAGLQVAGNNSQDCSKKLETKNAEVLSKDQKVATLKSNLNSLTEEKTKIQEQVTDLTRQLEQANATSMTLQTEIAKLSAELGTDVAITPEEEGVTADGGDKKEGDTKVGDVKEDKIKEEDKKEGDKKVGDEKEDKIKEEESKEGDNNKDEMKEEEKQKNGKKEYKKEGNKEDDEVKEEQSKEDDLKEGENKDADKTEDDKKEVTKAK